MERASAALQHHQLDAEAVHQEFPLLQIGSELVVGVCCVVAAVVVLNLVVAVVVAVMPLNLYLRSCSLSSLAVIW